jgi:hypothetical protein
MDSFLFEAMKYIFSMAFLCLYSNILFAQKHDAIIPMGYRAYAEPWEADRFDMNFSSGHIQLDTLKRKFEFSTTNTSICDSLGNLQFMANGCFVADKFGNLMQNGDGINNGITIFCSDDGARSFQAGIILPLPNQPFHYLLIFKKTTVATVKYSTQIAWSEIDMSLNNGKGKVIKKNQIIEIDSSHVTQLTACKHANGRDWWLISPPKDFRETYTMLLLDPTGLHVHHTQNFGKQTTYQTGLGKSLMQTLFSPNGEKYIRSSTFDSTRISDFDRCNGILSNEQLVSVPFDELTNGCGAGVSPNSRYLYLTNVFEIYQVDLRSQNSEQSKIRIDSMDGFKAELNTPMSFFSIISGADGKLYVIDGQGSFIFHTIHQPNEYGKACLFKQHDLSLPKTNILLPCNCWSYADMWYEGAPNFPFYRLGAIDGSACDTLGLDNHPLAGWHEDLIDTTAKKYRFADHSTYNPTSWFWDFGDGTTSQDTSPWHIFPSNGIYHVCLTVCNALSCDTLCYDIVVDDIIKTENEPVFDKKSLVFPNPTQDLLFFKMPSGLENVQLRAFDLMGKIVFSGLVENSISVSDWPSGIYFLSFSENGRTFQTEKVVVFH